MLMMCSVTCRKSTLSTLARTMIAFQNHMFFCSFGAGQTSRSGQPLLLLLCCTSKTRIARYNMTSLVSFIEAPRYEQNPARCSNTRGITGEVHTMTAGGDGSLLFALEEKN